MARARSTAIAFLALLGAQCFALVPVVRAYSAPEVFGERPTAGGGGGRWFSGSPAEGYGCSVCHSALEGQRHYPLYVAGLPLEGYELGATREIVMSWPEFSAAWTALRPDPMNPPGPEAPTPAMGLVAELVAESGRASGVIEIDAGAAGPQEQCEITRPSLKPRMGVKLYQVRPGLEPVQIRPDSTGLMHCESRQLGQRCLVALTSCGAQQIRMRWTAPQTWQGPIWFSAGFVATEALASDFVGDSVHEIRVPMLQAGGEGERYQRVLSSGCVLGSAEVEGGNWALLLLACSLLWMRRRRA